MINDAYKPNSSPLSLPIGKTKRHGKQYGFTVVEIAIVMVIIGILLAGILKGSSLVRSMYVKDVLAIAKDLSTASRYFKERYHYLPGDWPFTADEIPAVVAGGNGNGQIDTAAEIALIPNHLFNAGFIKGGTGQIITRYGAVRVVANSPAAGVGSATASGVNPVPATTLNLIEFDNLPCDVALEIDLKMDDGDISTGYARASVASCTSDDTHLNDPVPSFAVPL